MPPASPGRRLGLAAAAAAIAAATLLATPQAAGANAPALFGESAATTSTATVTLITGDRVQVAFAADGTASAMLESGADHYIRRDGADLYVIPVAAEAALAQGRLDPALFNVTGLVRQGYDDASSATLPLLLSGSLPQNRAFTGVSVGAHLSSIDATAVSVAKGSLGTLFGGTSRSALATPKIWLDAKVTGFGLDPATGVAQTGAPELWRSGYTGAGTKVAVLDTGYDPNHPDLAGRVAAAQDFTGDGEGAIDDAGHGTHVASTIAGTGAADASKKGMAPDTSLLIGKVLGPGGGQTSWIVAGMEWAVAQGADVVNMSLGSNEPTDCTDPMAEATRALTAQGKTLFVIAAGNSGMRETVSSPGCVEGVLTVGAVDAEGATANFSSRGPVPGSHALKPDLSAPGVAIAGAANGSPAGVNYTTMSGTSMATPHVAGAAALIRQAHPDWTAQQIKAALVASVKKDTEGTIYDQGAGEMWVPGALNASVTSDVSVQIATYDWPHGRDEKTTKTITYTNTGDRAVELDLDLTDATGADGRRIDGRAFDLTRNHVTVPAHGTATVGVTARGDLRGLKDGQYGEIGARLVAKGRHGVRVTTSVGFWLEPETVTVTFKALDRNGAAATSGYLDITDMHQPARSVAYWTGEDVTLRLRAGKYFVTSYIRTVDATGAANYAYVGDPEATYDEDTTVVLDAAKAVPVTVTGGDKPLQVRTGSIALDRVFGRWTVQSSLFAQGGRFYVSPTGKVREGEFHFGTYFRATDPAVAEADSSYVYNLAFTESRRVGRDQAHVVRDRDLGARTENFHAQRTASSAYEWTRVLPAGGLDPIYAGSGNPVTTPLTRTAYYSPGVTWQAIGATARIFSETWFDAAHTYRAREKTATDWFKLPTATSLFRNPDGTPSRVAERQGTLVGFAFQSWQDTSGRQAVGGFGDIGSMRIYKNGELIDESAWPARQTDVGSDDCVLRVEVGQYRIAKRGWELGLGTITSFEFASKRPKGDAVQALPIALPHYDAPVDAYNLAPNTDTAFPVAVTMLGQDGYDPGAITSFSAKVTYEAIDPYGDKPIGDYAWTTVPVVQRGGVWYALVDNTKGAGTTPSLWIDTVDSHGTKTRQISLNLYGIA
ncbi:hypothetical protein Afil01_06760 [Actinorhabdospora filicis]|uniref:Peptidase S8/S53 domain-containing protein n=1 Tax=Actinorhabdospora filicis TaxID=1785913 RepID=A0A9W6SES9_9ACTN|nr:S8 family serine peptidase [Actinorhabdospora filicis]GLZ75869.1 hypothetical protein Afil01_06760 [Actinorhabdospora filicis]